MASKSAKAAAKAEARKVNKSKSILTYHKSHPDAKPREIVAALARRGIELNAQYVSTILFNHRRRNGDNPRANREKTVALNAANVSARELMLAKQLVKQSGSIQAARKALDGYGNIIA